MHLRSVFIFLAIWTVWQPAVFAQKRVLATVNPNVDAYNEGADLFVPDGDVFQPAGGGMIEPREEHIAVPLIDGRVLVAGGHNNRYLRTAEIFDPASGVFAPNYQTIRSSVTGLDVTAPGYLKVPRSGAGGVLLMDGRVLVAGGYNGQYIELAEIYDPDTGAFGYTTIPMRVARYRPSMTLLGDGRVLVAGGVNTAFLASAEVFNPFTGSFSLTAVSMSAARQGHTATLLDDGRVLLVGGCANTNSDKIVCDQYHDSAEIYDPVLGTFEATGSLGQARAEHTATLLGDGRVLVAGGTDGDAVLSSAEIYDPATGAFSDADGMGTPRRGHTATVLEDGRVLFAGGSFAGPLAGAEIFSPASLTFAPVPSPMGAPRLHHTATVLEDGRVLCTGGVNTDPLRFDTNIRASTDNVSPNIVFAPGGQAGFVPYTGSGTVVAFSPADGGVLGRIATGGYPASLTPLGDGDGLAAVSALDNRIFILSMNTLSLEATYTFPGAEFGFGSSLALSPNGSRGYVASTGTGEIIQFDVATGAELRRRGGLETPAQITVTPDGGTLLVVDTGTTEIHWIDAETLGTRSSITLRDEYAYTGLSIYNRVVLDPAGERGVISSWDIDSSTQNALFILDIGAGTIAYKFLIGSLPAYTALTPDGSQWVILGDGEITLIPIESLGYGDTAKTGATPLSSANVVFSGDSRYAFFSSSTVDQVLQFDLETLAVVGAYQVGDVSNTSQDQPGGIAQTPDGEVLAVLNFMSNELDLLVDATMMKLPEFINDRDQFTGVTLINLSSHPASLTLKPYSESGRNGFALHDGTFGPVDPVTLPPLPPNGQFSLDLSQIFLLNNSTASRGHLEIISDQPEVVAFGVTGSIGSSFLQPRLIDMNGMTAYRFPERLYNWISPDLPLEALAEASAAAQFVFTNPNYNPSGYEIVHYGLDGSEIEGDTDGELDAAEMDVLIRSELFEDALADRVLVSGGTAGDAAYRSATLFSTDGQSFESAGSLFDARHGHTSSLMTDGRVLVAGGRNGTRVLNSAETYDPIRNRFARIIGTMIDERYRHTATALSDGTVLVAGGQNSVSINATAELFDSRTRTFAYTAGAMAVPRDAHTATLLPDGRVLLAGGIDGIGLTRTAELYDPDTSTFALTGAMFAGRAFHQAVLLADGRVLITGGYNGEYLDSAELYDPWTGAFTPLPPMTQPRSHHTATLLKDGSVLVTGGVNDGGVLDSAEIFYPVFNQFAPLSQPMTEPRAQHTATALPGGNILLVSGTDGYVVSTTSEVYYTTSQAFSKLSASQTAQRGHAATLLQGLMSGYLQGASGQGVLFRQKRGSAVKTVATDGINIDRYEGITATYAPYFVTLSPGMTILNLINANEEEDATVTVVLHGYDGSVIGAPVTVEIPIRHQVHENLLSIFHDDPAVRGQTGWIEVLSSVDRVVGTVSFGKAGGDLLSTFELSVAPLDDFIIPLSSENSDYLTQLSLLNAGGSAASVEIELWGEDGAMDASAMVALGPGEGVDGFLWDYFGMELSRLYGYIRVRSTQPLHGYAMLWDRGQGFACAMPPIPVPGP